MALETAVTQAARFLNLPDEGDALAVREALRAFVVETDAIVRNEGGRANRLRIDAARRARAACEPWLARVELAADLAEYVHRRATGSADPVRLKFDHQKLAGRIAALPAGDERDLLQLQLEQAPPPAPGVEPAPFAVPPAPPPADPAQAAFDAKLSELGAALATGSPDQVRLSTLMDTARALAGVLRDAGARSAADAALAALDLRVGAVLAALPPARQANDPAARAVYHKLAELRTAVETKNVGRALVLLEAAQALGNELANESAGEAVQAQLDLAASRIAQLLAPPAVDPDETACREVLAALREALDRGDVARATTASREAESLITSLPASSARAAFLEEWRILTERLDHAVMATPVQPVPPAATVTSPPPTTTPPAPPAMSAPPSGVGLEPPPAATPVTGTTLTLVPRREGFFTGPMVNTLRFVVRDRFVFGRDPKVGPARADFLVPKTFGQVSRANVTFSRQAHEILVQDGDEKGPSTNGSKLDDQPLTSQPVAAGFQHDRTLVIGQVFPVMVRHIPSSAPLGPPIDPGSTAALDGRTIVIHPITGAMRFTAVEPVMLPWIAVWLFTDATIGSAADCAVSLPHAGLADAHARVHAWQGKFWIESLRSGTAVRLGSRAVAKGRAMPLQGGDLLHLAHLTFDVSIED